jgi:phosphotransferase system HPr-like phosphotransfer protein
LFFYISLNGKTVDAKKLVDVMGLCAKQNDPLIFSVEGENEQGGCKSMKEFDYKQEALCTDFQ